MRARHNLLLPMSVVSAAGTVQTSLSREICPWTSLLSSIDQYSCTPSDGLRLLDEDTEWPATQPAEIPIQDDGPNADTWTRAHNCVDQYCVSSNKGFLGQGIAIVTNSQARQHIEQSQSIMANSTAKPKFRTTKVPGKGNGLVATDAISRGELIMDSSPALLVHQGVFGELELEDIYELLDTAVDSLPRARRASYLAQAAKMGGHRIADILFTNSYQNERWQRGGFHYGNFPDASLLNHDCRPNLAFHIDQDLTYRAHAVRDINPGEELTISYLDPFQPQSARQERARKTLGFSCSCSLCSASKKEIDASDARLRSIRRIEDELADFSSQVASPVLIEKLVSLYEKERLEFKIAGAYTTAALNYNLFGKAQPAQKYAKMAVEAGRVENGPDNADVREMQEIWENPQAHWSWNLKRYG